jgi:hypothetical protein
MDLSVCFGLKPVGDAHFWSDDHRESIGWEVIYSVMNYCRCLKASPTREYISGHANEVIIL